MEIQHQLKNHNKQEDTLVQTAEYYIYQVKRKRYNRIRRIIYYSYILLSIIILLFLFYHYLDNSTILMYAPDNWKTSKDIDEIMYYKSIQHIIEIYAYCMLYLTAQIIIATIIFIITKKRKNG